MVTGADGTTQYCASKQVMNWWSANAWCDALGKELVDITKECPKISDGEICTQVFGVSALKNNRYYWTKNVPTTNWAYAMYPSNAKFVKPGRSEVRCALCVMN